MWRNDSATTTDLTTINISLQNNLSSNDNTSVTFDDFRIENAAIPEPTSLGLLAIGAAAMIRRRRN